jgi:hypothetical protein
LPTPRPPRQPPTSIVELSQNPFGVQPPPDETDEQRRQREVTQLVLRVPRNYNAGELTLSPAAGGNAPAAVIQTPIFQNGINGQALFFDETNKGFLGKDVGWYDRTQPFSIDFWFYAAEAYDKVPIINHPSRPICGGLFPCWMKPRT